MTILTKAQLSLGSILVLSGALPAQQPIPPEPCAHDTVCVLYTARLLGYIRNDDSGLVNQKFDANMESAKKNYPHALRVGMGDNLAPEYGSRMQSTPAGQAYHAYKLRNNSGPADNVAGKLNNDYHVIVPGKEDFYFGAERLRRLGTAPDSKFSAANMAETPSYSTPAREPNEPGPRGYVASHPQAKPFDDGHVVSQRLVDNRRAAYSIEIAKSVVQTQPGSPGDPGDRVSSPSLQICDADHPDSCSRATIPAWRARHSEKADFDVVTYDLSSVTSDLHPGMRRLFCFTGLSKPPLLSEHEWDHHNRKFCRAVTVDDTMFRSFPYTAVSEGGTNYAVFAVAAPELTQSLSLINRSWGADDDKVQAQVAIWDPAGAIRQAYYECRLNQQCADGVHIVVLAQMTRSDGRQLVDNLPDVAVDLVITKGEDTASPYGQNLDYASAGEPVPVIGTHSIFTMDDRCSRKGSAPDDSLRQATLRNPLHLIALNSDGTVSHFKAVPDGPGHSEADWCIAKTLAQRPDPSATPTFPLDALAAKTPWSAPDLEHFIAEQMRDRYLGDIGIVSTHEIFREIATAGTNLAEQTERVIWEGAHIARARLSGKQLRAAFDASKNADSDRQLVASGLVANDNKDYYVNGKPLDDSAYYTVIAPDALVYGEPSYPDLSDDTFQRPKVYEETVAGFVCRILGPGQPCTAPVSLALPAPTLTLDPPPAFHPRSYILSVVAPDHHDPLQHLADNCQQGTPCAGTTETRVQYRHLWFAKLQKNDLSYSLSKPSTTDQSLPIKFGGVTDTRVVQAHTETYSVDHDLRLGLAWSHAALGVEETVQFGRNRQGSTSGGGDSVTLTSNRGAIGPFFEYAFLHNSAPNWRVILRPADFSDNFARTKTDISGSNSTSFSVSLPAQRAIASAVGLRWEAPQRKDSLFGDDGNTFFESGYKSTFSINLPAALTLNPGTASPTVCSLASSTFAQCASAVVAVDKSALITGFENNRQNGWYWNAMFSFPIGKRFTYKAASAGDLRFGDNLASEPVYAISIDNYLKTQIWGNFSLAPHMGWFLFENQVENNSLTRRTYDVSLTYTFDWHRGLGIRALLKRPDAK